MNGPMSAAPPSRKFPRATITQRAVMIVRGLDDKAPKRRVTVALRSVSCEGVGVSISEPCTVERRAPVTVDFNADGHHFEIPGLVAWVGTATVKGSPFDLGVKLQLTAATSKTRQDYAQWIVNLLRKQGI